MAWSLLTHTQKDAAASPITTTAIDTTGATCLVVATATAATTITLTDSQSNKWFSCFPSTAVSTQVTTLFFCFNPSTSATHTFTLSASTFPCLAVASFSGSQGALTNHTEATVNPGTTLLMPTLTPPNNNALVVTSICMGTTNTASIDGGFSISDQGGGSSGQKVALAYLIQGTAAAAAPTWTVTGSQAFSGQMFAIGLASATAGYLPVN